MCFSNLYMKFLDITLEQCYAVRMKLEMYSVRNKASNFYRLSYSYNIKNRNKTCIIIIYNMLEL